MIALGPTAASAQPTRLAVLQAEDRRAPTVNDLAVIRSGAHSRDPQTVQIAVRALGRLERPSLIPDITPALKSLLSEIRAEAANAVGQAAQGWKKGNPPTAPALDAVVASLVGRLKVEAESDVRSAICQTIGRLPYTTATQAENAERTLVESAARSDTVADRLGVAQGLEALVRFQRKLRSPSDDAIALLREFAGRGNGAAAGARVRRLALEALIAVGATTGDLRLAASRDSDLQVRRLAMRAASTAQPVSDADGDVLKVGLADPSPIVRVEALRGLAMRGADRDDACAAATASTADADTHVALVALDQLAACGAAPDAVARLVRAVNEVSDAGAPRGWHRAAHALVALAAAAPDRGTAALPQFTGSRVWQLRLYAARAAATLKNRDVLVTLAGDDDDNVREAAIEGLRKVAGHDADETYVAELARPGYQVVRVSALALDGTPHFDRAVPALKNAWQRLVAEGRDNSHDARDAIAKTLASLGADPRVKPGAARGVGADPRVGPGRTHGSAPAFSADELRRLAAPRARVTIRGVGTFELALFAMQAPATVLRFAHLAETGYYNGLTVHRVVPNFVIQGGSPGANEFVGDASFMRDEVGLWPHVRGAVGISTRGRDTGDAQIFIDLVDNPRLDHEYTVFAQVLNGMDVVDQVLEGDVIEKIEIVAGQ
ncbi:MAG: peptidylprolyl isomerase [Acidobacteria bacterium]|nr:peptidylprolyl isomerase [Acidobacteriota bacterium]